MARLLSESELRRHISEAAAPGTMTALRAVDNSEVWILEGSSQCAEGVKYDFRLGSRILLGGRQPIDATRLTESERAAIAIGPGEMAYVLTQEVLVLPADVKAEIGLKRKLSHAGIILHGGSCADPGYRGRLLFALFNFSSRPFPLQPGKKLVAAQFYVLEEDETPPARPLEIILDFPDDIVHLMAEYRPSTALSLVERLTDLRQQVDALNKLVRERDNWFVEFKASLTDTQQLVNTLARELSEERTNRIAGQEEFKKRLEDISSATARHAVYWAIAIAFAGMVAAALIAKFLG